MVLMYRKPGVGQRRHIMPSRLKNNIHYSLPDIKVRNSEFSILIGLAQQKKRPSAASGSARTVNDPEIEIVNEKIETRGRAREGYNRDSRN